MGIEDYAFIGDTRTGALVHRDGSLDWLCLPAFDGSACFAALLGGPENGRWSLRPAAAASSTRRQYRGETLVLQTEWETASGAVRLIDCMPPGEGPPRVVRVVEGIEGRVEMRMELTIRFDYGWIVPWVRTEGGVLRAVAGPDALELRTPVRHHGQDLSTVATFEVKAGERIPFVLTWYPAHREAPPPLDALGAIQEAETWWRRWVARCTYQGPWRDAVIRSLLTLKALIFAPTGGIVAAATTSLPEWPGGVRNWDYRYVWLRDATFSLHALLAAGFHEEAIAWREWLLRAVAGTPRQLNIMYGLHGERRLPELVLDWLPGYAGSRPVRTGNAAALQHQTDIYGELMDVLHFSRRSGIPPDANAWRVQQLMMEDLERTWALPDEGLWEVRSHPRQFTHSKVMAWVAFDRALRAIEQDGVDGPRDRWRRIRDTIHREVCARGWNSDQAAFTQSYGSTTLDASLLMMPLVGFLPADDPRMVSTLAAIERELIDNGLVRRYQAEAAEDGLPGGEGAFFLCSFWLVDNYALAGRMDEALALFERLLSLRNDVGLLSEECDPATGRLLGNFPQTFSHVGLINTAFNLTPGMRPKPALDRHRR